MPALTVERDTIERNGSNLNLPVAAAKKIFAGSLVARDGSGNATPGAVATTILGAGRAKETVDNSGGSAGDLTVEIEKGIFRFGNSASTDLIARADSLDNRGTDESRWRKKAKDAKEYEKAAKAAMAAGDNEKALSLSDKARELFSSLKGGAGNISDETAQRSAYSGVKSSGELGLAISKMMQQVSAKGALASLPAGNDMFGNMTANIRQQLGNVAGGGGNNQGAPGGNGQAPVHKVHELRFPGGTLRGGEDDVENLIKHLAKAGLNAA